MSLNVGYPRCLVASELNTLLFGNYRIATATSVPSKYEPTFGGPHDRKGTSRDDCNGILIHLLHRLDLTDPAIPFRIPGIRWLPFYYCFDFRANDLGYRLISDEELVTYFPEDDPNVSKEESWPDDNYPQEFPRSRIQVAAHDYDPTSKMPIGGPACSGSASSRIAIKPPQRSGLPNAWTDWGLVLPRRSRNSKRRSATPSCKGSRTALA
jgi:hypothetical protein